MILRLELENFMSHESSRLDLGAVNLIIPGNRNMPNDVGKTNIVRALRTVLYNDPFPERYVRHGKSVSSISVWLDSGVIVCRKREKSTQKLLVMKDGKLEEYPNKSQVDDYIQDLTGFRKMDRDSRVYLPNLFLSTDPYTFVSCQPKTLYSRVCSRVLGGRVPAALKIVRSSIKSTKAQLDELKSRVQEGSELLRKIEEAKELILSAREKIREVEERKGFLLSRRQYLLALVKGRRLASLIEDTNSCIERVVDIEKALTVLPIRASKSRLLASLNSIEVACNSAENLRTRVSNLEKVSKLSDLRQKMVEVSLDLETRKSTNPSQLEYCEECGRPF